MPIPRIEPIPRVAELTGLTYDHIMKLCKTGKIVFIKSGRKHLVNMESVEKYLEAQQNLKVEPISRVAELTGLTTYCIYKLCKEGKIASIKVGRKFMINMESLENYLQTGETA